MKSKIIPVIPVILFFTVHSLVAQTSTELPELVVTGQSRPESLTSPPLTVIREKLNTVPGGVDLIDAEDYKRGRATTLKDALDYAPGVFVQPRFGAEEARLSIRGSGIQRTFHGRGIELLQDGVPLNLADGSFDFQAVEPLATRDIEVYRGANALEFGSTTLGGAINFVSYTGYDAPPLDIRFEYGSFDSFHAQIASAGVYGALDYYASLTRFSTSGFRDHSDQSSWRLFTNLGYKLTPNLETRFYVTYVSTDSQLPGDLTKAQLDKDPTQASRVPPELRSFQPVARFDYVTSNWQRNFDLFRLANKTTWLNGDDELSITTFWAQKDLNHPILFVIDQLSNDFGLNVRYDHSGEIAGHENHLTIGLSPTIGVTQDSRFANVFGNRGSKIGDNELTASNVDLYFQTRFKIAPAFSLVTGAQTTYSKRENQDDFPVSATDPDNSDTQDWWGFSPKVGVLWDMTPTVQIYGNLSGSFEPPSFGELANAANNQTGLVQLEAQTATALEAGTRGAAGMFTWDIAWYYAWLDNELLQYQVQPGLTQTINAGRTIHQGVEAALEVELLPKNPSGGVVLRQNYLWNDFRFEDDPVFGNNHLPGIPEHYYRAELLYEHLSGFYAGPNVEWVIKGYNVDSEETFFADSYALLNARIGWRRESGFSVFVDARNLTDKKYAATTEVIADANGMDGAYFLPGDGRGFYFGVEWRW